MQENILKNRKNYRFYTDAPVPKELEDCLDAIINSCPVQRGQTTVARFLKCTQDDLHVKETLSRWVFKNDLTSYNELAPITAPLVYFVCSAKNQPDDNKHAYLTAGAMLVETMRFGYDFSFIGCTEEPIRHYKKVIQKCIINRFGIKKPLSQPYLALCIGKGEEDESSFRSEYKLLDGSKIQYSKKINRDRIAPKLFT